MRRFRRTYPYTTSLYLLAWLLLLTGILLCGAAFARRLDAPLSPARYVLP